MNERIQALIDEADEVEILPDEDFCGTDFLADMDPRRVKVFAELLIQEFVRCAEGEWIRNGDTEHNRAVSGVIESIKERFGVEQN